MSIPSLTRYLSLWEHGFDQGRDVPAAELCPDHPSLAAGLQDAIDALRQVRQLLSETTNDAVRTVDAPPTVCPPGYEILGVLGRGAMGVVYHARQVPLGREVALKMILAGPHAGEVDRARFLSEAQAVAGLRHPGIVQVHDYGTHAGHPYLALELCDGGSLADRLRDGPLAAAEAAHLVEQLALAMQAAHDGGIVHRDLKPGNVLLQNRSTTKHTKHTKEDKADGKELSSSFRVFRVFRGSCLLPKVADFGLAKHLTADAGLTQPGAVVGSPPYMSPEQAAGTAVTAASDVYALGAILYECLTGRPPFLAAGVLETLRLVQTRDPVPPRRLNPQVPRDVETICHKCLQKEPGRRYPTAAALADDLRRWQAGEPIRARPVGIAERAWKWARRYPVVAALLATIAVGVGVAFALVDRERRKTAEALHTAETNLTHAERARAEAVASLTEAAAAVDECLGLACDDPRLQGDHQRWLRKLLLEKTLPYYQSFADRDPVALGLQAKQADYLFRVAVITAEVAGRADAARHYEEAQKVLRQLRQATPGEDRYAAELARVSNQLAAMQFETNKPTEARASFEEALAIQIQLLQAKPADARRIAAAARTRHNLGTLHRLTAHPREAREQYDLARKAQEGLVRSHPKEPKYRAELANTLHNLGVLHRETSNPKAALDCLDEARRMRDQLRKDSPNVAAYEADLARTLTQLGQTQQQGRRPKEALESHEQARRLLEKLRQAFPDVTAYQADLASAYHHLGILLADDRKLADARQRFEEARRLQDQLHQAHPEAHAYLADRARTDNNLGNVFRLLGQPREAIASYTLARQALETLTAANQQVPQYQVELAGTLNNLGILYRVAGDHARAIESYERARAVQLRLSQAHPDVPAYAAGLGGIDVNLGLLHRTMNQPREALVALDRAVPVLRAAAEREADNPGRRLFLRNAHWERAQTLGLLGRHRQAVADWDEVLRLNANADSVPAFRVGRAMALARAGEYRAAAAEVEPLARLENVNGPTLDQLACALSLSAAACRRDAARPLAAREWQAERWATGAVGLLRRAERAGYFKEADGAARLSAADLAFVRERADFRALVRAVGGASR